MRFLIDSMLPPQVVELLCAMGHEAVAPSDIGAHSLPDEVLIQIASAGRWVIVTENAMDFAHVTTCPVLFVRKCWWPAAGSPSAWRPRSAAGLTEILSQATGHIGCRRICVDDTGSPTEPRDVLG